MIKHLERTVFFAFMMVNSLSAQMVGNLADGLVAYYPLHSDIKDYSSNGNDLISSTGNSSFVSGSLSIGDNEYLYSKNKIGISGNQSRTVSLWFKPSSTPSSADGGYLASWGVGNKFWGDSTLMYSSAWSGDGSPAFAYVASGSWDGVSVPSVDNNWTNITYVYDGNPYTSSFYINGVLNNTLIGWADPVASPLLPDTVDTQVFFNARTFSTGSGEPIVDEGVGIGINGNYKDIAIYNRALSGSEVAQLVPEPSALSLFAVGLGALALVRRRRS